MRKHKKISKAVITKHRNIRRDKQEKDINSHKKKIEKIKKSSGVLRIGYPEYKESFDYVDNLFSTSKVKEVVLYKASARLLEKLGFGEAGGFYDKSSKIIVFSGRKRREKQSKYAVCGKLEADEVIAHELLHYCYFKEGKSCISIPLQEEFAYGWSLGYLRGKGYSDEEIIKYNYLPFLYSTVRDDIIRRVFLRNNITIEEYNCVSPKKKRWIFKKHMKEIHEESLKLANEKGRKLIFIYSKKLQSERIAANVDDRKPKGFSFLDLD